MVRYIRVSGQGAGVWNPVFDVVPASVINRLVAEQGIVERRTTTSISALLDA